MTIAMDKILRNPLTPRSQIYFGLPAPTAAARRPLPDDRVDVPEVQESTRVSFSRGAAVRTTGEAPDAARGLALYRAVQSL